MTVTLLIFLILTVLIPFISFKLTSDKQAENTAAVKIIGHRGAATIAPENTLVSFKKAMDIGVDMVELDVHVSQDDSVIVMHDYNVKRTSNGTGDIQDLSYNYIKSLDAGSWFKEEFKGEKIPTLDEVLTLINGKTKVLVELKWPKKGIYKNLMKLVVETIKRHHAESWVVLQTFETAYLKEAITLAPGIECQQLVFGKSGLLPVYFDRNIGFGNFQPENNVTSVNIFYLYLNKSLIQKMHAENRTVYAFTLDKKSDIIRAVNIGADGIITNDPGTVIQLLRSK